MPKVLRSALVKWADPLALRLLLRFPAHEIVSRAAFSLDGSRLCIMDAQGVVRVHEVQSGKEIRKESPNDKNLWFVALSPDGGRLFTATSQVGFVRALDVKSGKEIWKTDLHESIHVVALSSDGSRLVTGHTYGSVGVLDARSGKEVWKKKIGGAFLGVAFSPDGIQLATGDLDGFVRVLDAQSGKEIWKKKFTRPIGGVVFSPDGGRLVTGDWDGIVRALDAKSGREIWEQNLAWTVQSVAFSPDGSRVITTDVGPFVHILDAQSGKVISKAKPGEAVFATAFSPDGIRLATGDLDGVVRVWIMPSSTAGMEEVVAVLQREAVRTRYEDIMNGIDQNVLTEIVESQESSGYKKFYRGGWITFSWWLLPDSILDPDKLPPQHSPVTECIDVSIAKGVFDGGVLKELFGFSEPSQLAQRFQVQRVGATAPSELLVTVRPGDKALRLVIPIGPGDRQGQLFGERVKDLAAVAAELTAHFPPTGMHGALRGPAAGMEERSGKISRRTALGLVATALGAAALGTAYYLSRPETPQAPVLPELAEPLVLADPTKARLDRGELAFIPDQLLAGQLRGRWLQGQYYPAAYYRVRDGQGERYVSAEPARRHEGGGVSFQAPVQWDGSDPFVLFFQDDVDLNGLVAFGKHRAPSVIPDMSRPERKADLVVRINRNTGAPAILSDTMAMVIRNRAYIEPGQLSVNFPEFAGLWAVEYAGPTQEEAARPFEYSPVGRPIQIPADGILRLSAAAPYSMDAGPGGGRMQGTMLVYPRAVLLFETEAAAGAAMDRGVQRAPLGQAVPSAKYFFQPVYSTWTHLDVIQIGIANEVILPRLDPALQAPQPSRAGLEEGGAEVTEELPGQRVERNTKLEVGGLLIYLVPEGNPELLHIERRGQSSLLGPSHPSVYVKEVTPGKKRLTQQWLDQEYMPEPAPLPPHYLYVRPGYNLGEVMGQLSRAGLWQGFYLAPNFYSGTAGLAGGGLTPEEYFGITAGRALAGHTAVEAELLGGQPFSVTPLGAEAGAAAAQEARVAEATRLVLDLVENPDIASTLPVMRDPGQLEADISWVLDPVRTRLEKLGYQGNAWLLSPGLLPDATPFTATMTIYIKPGEETEGIYDRLAPHQQRYNFTLVKDPSAARVVVGGRAARVRPDQALIRVDSRAAGRHVIAELLVHLDQQGRLSAGSIVWLYKGGLGEDVYLFA
ncbi:MAG: WD40 repeat domain-containing protein [Candidatus Omnitrophica bacterium]|nr:WD40 repeat domain-containing protein [Candidatus Omnitrophota bacterium]